MALAWSSIITIIITILPHHHHHPHNHPHHHEYQVYPELDEALLGRVMGTAKLTIMEENSFSGHCLFFTMISTWDKQG